MPRKIIENKLEEILKQLKVNPEVSIDEEEDAYKIKIYGDDLSFLIGYRGQSLEGLQTLLSHMLFNETNEWTHIIVDINDYRESRIEKIQDMVRNFIDRARFHNTEVEMPSMNSYERRQVHMFVSDYPDIESESTGVGRNRRVVLKLKEND